MVFANIVDLRSGHVTIYYLFREVVALSINKTRGFPHSLRAVIRDVAHDAAVR